MLYALAVAAACLLASRGLIHYFQLESYQFPGYFRTLKRNWKNALLPGFLLMAVLLVAGFFLRNANSTVLRVLVTLCVMLITLGAIGHFDLLNVKKAKKPLVFTPRVKRLYAVAAVVYLLICWALPVGWLFPLLLPLWVARRRWRRGCDAPSVQRNRFSN